MRTHHLLTRLLALALTLPVAAALPAGPARAEGSEVRGHGFTLRLPTGFKPAGSSDEDDGCERFYRRRVDAGEMLLTLASSEQSGDAEADLEMTLGSKLDQVELRMDDPQGEAQTHEVVISGASQAHATSLTSPTRFAQRLTARRGTLLVSVSLTAPADAAEEAAALWSGLLGSLRLEEPGNGLMGILPFLVGALALLAVGLRLLRGPSGPVPTARSADGFVPLTQGGPPAYASTPPPPYEPVHMPAHAPSVPRETLGGFSRAADGMPIFDATAKARGVGAEALKLPEIAPRRPAPPKEPAAPKPAPTLRPPTPLMRL